MRDNSQMNIKDMVILSVLNFVPVKMKVNQPKSEISQINICMAASINIACVPSVFLVSSVTVY